MNFFWAKDLSLLLIYKDPLGHDPLAGSYSRAPSYSIQQHLNVRRMEAPQPKRQKQKHMNESIIAAYPDQLSLFTNQAGNTRYRKEVKPGCAVWGWWRKSWETHHRVLQCLKEAVEKGQHPNVLLYNQYSRRLYSATLHDLYFEQDLTSVVIPADWFLFCPETYRSVPHLCGAFFVLRIDPNERNAGELLDLFTDSASFELDSPLLVVAPPEGVPAACDNMVDTPPRRQNLRSCEQTLLVLRSYKQQEKTHEILRRLKDHVESDVAHAIAETSWQDLAKLLARLPPSVWAELGSRSLCIEEVGRKLRTATARATRFDFELFCRLCAATGVAEILVANSDDTFREVGAATRDWLLSATERDAREAAAKIFEATWRFAGGRYGLAAMPERYFRNLPAIEAIASAVKHEIGRKFYRDHLSHNVRAALLSAALFARDASVTENEINRPIVGFVAGLFHDIALPLSSFPETVGDLAAALREVQFEGTAEKRPVPVIVDRRTLRKSLHYVALLASIKRLPTVSKTEAFRPWENEAAVLELTDPQILTEELLCLSSDEHALMSAALLFDYAVAGAAGGAGTHFDTNVRTVLGQVMGKTSSSNGREFAAILQAMALHDRRPAAKHHAVDEPPKDTPKVLSFEDFEIPVTVQIADELQEWGRTLGRLDEIGATDAEIEFESGWVRANFTLTSSEDIFAAVPFSPLEYLFGKLRALGRLRTGSDAAGGFFRFELGVREASAFRLTYLAPSADCRIVVDEPYDFLDFTKWPAANSARRQIGEGEGDIVLGLCVGDELHPRDILAVAAPEAIAEQIIQASGVRVSRLTIEGRRLSIELTSGFVFTLNLLGYRFGRLSETTAPAHVFASGKATAIVSAELERIEPGDSFIRRELERHLNLRPHPHFLDFDWRFEHATCDAVFRSALNNRAGGTICYLGCPSVALWHAYHLPEDSNWMLLDRGHYALEQWLKAGSWMPADRYIKYDVFEAVPEGLLNSIDVVVTDPPWYEPEYRLFTQRAIELVKPRGIIGLTYYPESLDARKFELFRKTVFGQEVAGFRQFGSIEIAYSPPEFERVSDLHRMFQHPELGIYRSGFMDFFEAPEEHRRRSEPVVDSTNSMGLLPRTLALPDEHHLRCLDEEEWLRRKPPFKVRFDSYGVERPRKVSEKIVGWSTRNTIAVMSASKRAVEIQNCDDLATAISEFERSGRASKR